MLFGTVVVELASVLAALHSRLPAGLAMECVRGCVHPMQSDHRADRRPAAHLDEARHFQFGLFLL